MGSPRSRSFNHERARPVAGGVAIEHARTIYGAGGTAIVVVLAFLALTSTGHVIDKATQHFMLFYAGVFALIALCASVGLGLLATDRIVLDPGRRVFVQSMHRAASFAAVAFLAIHIVTEIVAQRVHVIDSFVPFLSPFRTFYIGLGTIASDLVVLLVITSILRRRFTTDAGAWRWRAIHYTSYVGFVLGIWHGLLAGRTAKPYVDWSYGFLIVLTLLGLAVRTLSHPSRHGHGPVGGTAPDEVDSRLASMRVAALGMAGTFGTGPQPRLGTGPQLGLGTGPQPRAGTGPQPRIATGPQPRLGTGPQPRFGTGPQPQFGTGPQPRFGTGPQPRFGTGPQPRAATGPQPRVGTGPQPRLATGPQPRLATGPQPRFPAGPQPRATRVGTGPQPLPGTGPRVRQDTGPQPRLRTGPQPAMPSPPPGPPPPPPPPPGPPPWHQAHPPFPHRPSQRPMPYPPTHQPRQPRPHPAAPPNYGPPPTPHAYPSAAFYPPPAADEPDGFGTHPYPAPGGVDWR